MNKTTKSIAAIIVLLLMLVIVVPTSSSNNAGEQAQAAQTPVVNCQVVTGPPVRVVCKALGATVLDTAITVPTITLPPIQLPGETTTVTVPPVEIPGPTQTVTEPAGPQPTATVTENSTQTETVTIEPSQLPEPPTVTVTEPGQETTDYVTVVPTPQAEPNDDDNGILPDTIVEKAAVTTLGIILLMGLIILGMWLGYYLGRKDENREQTSFLKAMSDKLIVRKH